MEATAGYAGIDRANRKISKADQINKGGIIWRNWGDRWADIGFSWKDSDKVLTVTLDSGEVRSLQALFKNVLSMWEAALVLDIRTAVK